MKIKIILVILITILIFGYIGCDGNEKYVNSIDNYLNSFTKNTIDSPINLEIKTDLYLNWSAILEVLVKQEKYVSLNLYNSTGMYTFSPGFKDGILGQPISGSEWIVSIILPKNTDKIDAYAFKNWLNLTSLTFSANTNIDYYAFEGCINLISFTLTGNGSLSSIENGKALVLNNTELVAYPSASGIIMINNVTEIRMGAFSGCINMTSASFPDVTRIGYAAFGWCTNLADISLPMVVNIGGYAFRDCKSLTEVIFPMVIEIGGGAFSYCTNLTKVFLPKTTNIYNGVFHGCYLLEEVFSPAVVSIGNGIFGQNSRQPLIITMGNIAPSVGTNIFYIIDWSKDVIVKIPSDAVGFNTNWQDGFLGKGWDGSFFGSGILNSNINLSINNY